MAETFDLGNALMRGARMGSQIADARRQNNALSAGMMPTSDGAFVQPVNVPISIGGQTVNQPMSPMNALKFQQGQEDRAYEVGQRPLERGQMEAETGLTEAQTETERERVGLVKAQSAEATANAAATASETEIEEARFEAAQLYNAARQAWSDGPEAWDRFEEVFGDDLAQSGFDPVQVGYDDGLMILGALGGVVEGLTPEYLDRAMAGLREGRVAPEAEADLPADVRTFDEMAARLGVEPGTAAYEELAERVMSGGGVTNNVTTGETETAFQKETGKRLADEAANIVDQGATAQRNLATIGRLGQLLQETPGGAAGALASVATNLGIKLEGSSNIEAAEALISQLVPQQRTPGSGAMSDADLALFKRSLPRLANTPEGNEKIVETMRRVAEYDVTRGRIARQLQLGEISPSAAADRYAALGNPLDEFRQGAEPSGAGGDWPKNEDGSPDWSSMNDSQMEAYFLANPQGGGN